MKILDILNEPWLITPEKLKIIQDVYITHLHREKIPEKDFQALIDKVQTASKNPANSDQKAHRYGLIDSVAIIPIQGIIAKRMNLFTYFSGGVSTQLLAQDLADALSDPDVRSILLDIDSPGGTVDGTQELAQAVYQARAKKPVVAFTDGMMASAAYWIGSAAQSIYINGDTTWVGSIGVVTEHVDVSKWEEMHGYKTTEITAGRLKRLTSQYGPLSDDGRAQLQDIVDQIYDIFTREVALHRSAAQDSIKKTEARTYLGKDAIKAGLADRVSTKERLIGRLAKDGGSFVLRERVEAEIDRLSAAQQKEA